VASMTQGPVHRASHRLTAGFVAVPTIVRSLGFGKWVACTYRFSERTAQARCGCRSLTRRPAARHWADLGSCIGSDAARQYHRMPKVGQTECKICANRATGRWWWPRRGVTRPPSPGRGRVRGGSPGNEAAGERRRCGSAGHRVDDACGPLRRASRLGRGGARASAPFCRHREEGVVHARPPACSAALLPHTDPVVGARGRSPDADPR
jgi:hypothetical protein